MDTHIGRPPDFICIGAQNGGATWLYHVLADHPDVWLPPGGEIGFFSGQQNDRRDLMRLRQGIEQEWGKSSIDKALLRWLADFALEESKDSRWYLGLFAASGRKAAGEIATSYARLKGEQIAGARALAPNAKIIFMMRNPIERLWDLFKAVTPTYRHDKEQLIAEGAYWETVRKPSAEENTRYLHILERWEAVFPKEQFLYLFYDDLIAEPLTLLAKVCDFLEVKMDPALMPKSAIPIQPGHDVNTPLALRKFVADTYLEEFEALARRFGGPVDRWCDEMRQAQQAPLEGGAGGGQVS